MAHTDDSNDVPDFRNRAMAVLLERGCRLSEAGRCREALDCFDRALALEPEDPEALFWAGQERMHLCDFGKAEELLQLAWSRDPQLVGSARLLARLWLEHLHRPDLSRELIAEARALHPDNLGLLKSEADLLLALHEPRRASELYEQVLRAEPEDGEARDGLAVACNELAFELHQQGQTEEAVFWLRRALHVTPDWSGLHVNLGQMFAALGRHRLACKEFLAAAEEDPYDPVATFNLARLTRRLGETEQAIAWFGKTLDLDDDYPDARPELASLLYEQGQHARAVDLLEEEVLRDPSCPICHHNLALALLQTGQPDRAQAHLERALDLDPGYFRAHYNLAALCAARGEVQQALEHLETAFQLNPDSTRSWLDLDRRDFAQLASHPRLLQLLGSHVEPEEGEEHGR